MNFLRRHQRKLYIIIFIATTIFFGWLIWKLFFSSSTTEILLPEETATNNGSLPSAGPNSGQGDNSGGSGLLPESGNLDVVNPDKPDTIAVGGVTETTSVTNSRTLAATSSKNGGIQYYDKNDGTFYRVRDDGQVEKISDKVFYNVDNVTWAPDKNQAVIEYPDGSNIYYNFNSDKQVTLPSYWEEFSFSPNSQEIVAKSIGLDVENRWLTVADTDGSNAINLERIGNNADKVYSSWSPNNQMVAMYTKGIDGTRQNLYFVGLNDENFKSTIIEGRGFESQWSGDGKKLIYSVYNANSQYKPELWVVDASSDNIGGNRKKINLETWASKCTFSSNTEMYCAVPNDLADAAGMFPELAEKSEDNIYKINIQTGSKEKIASPDGSYNISQMSVSDSGEYLYFTDSSSEKIYKIKLK